MGKASLLSSGISLLEEAPGQKVRAQTFPMPPSVSTSSVLRLGPGSLGSNGTWLERLLLVLIRYVSHILAFGRFRQFSAAQFISAPFFGLKHSLFATPVMGLAKSLF